MESDPRETATALTAILDMLEPMHWSDVEGKRVAVHAIAAEVGILRGCVQRRCLDCGGAFWLQSDQIAWHRERQQHLPVRCVGCRRERRLLREATVDPPGGDS
jgi:hypothetical protein